MKEKAKKRKMRINWKESEKHVDMKGWWWLLSIKPAWHYFTYFVDDVWKMLSLHRILYVYEFYIFLSVTLHGKNRFWWKATTTDKVSQIEFRGKRFNHVLWRNFMKFIKGCFAFINKTYNEKWEEEKLISSEKKIIVNFMRFI